MSGPTLLARHISALTATALGSSQPALVGLVANWANVVGRDWAARCVPQNWQPGRAGRAATLELAVPPGLALIVQHELPVLLQRVNAYFGHGAVGQLRLCQVEKLPLREHQVADSIPIKPVAVENITDPELAAALGRLGGALAARPKR